MARIGERCVSVKCSSCNDIIRGYPNNTFVVMKRKVFNQKCYTCMKALIADPYSVGFVEHAFVSRCVLDCWKDSDDGMLFRPGDDALPLDPWPQIRKRMELPHGEYLYITRMTFHGATLSDWLMCVYGGDM